MEKRTYTKLDENNVAVIEIQEVRNILNKQQLLDQKEEITKKYNEDVTIIDEALSQFTTTT